MLCHNDQTDRFLLRAYLLVAPVALCLWHLAVSRASMGSGASKEEHTVAFMAERSTPVMLTPDVIDQVTGEQKPAATEEAAKKEQGGAIVHDAPLSETDVDALVGERVQEELARLRHQEVQKQLLALERKNMHSEALRRDIESLRGRQRILQQLELHPELKRRQNAVAACYRQHKDQPLECWQEVRDFRYAVERAGEVSSNSSNRLIKSWRI
ncbi:hypothetical protein SYNPS1DRAFT_29229 [Syncephalis pseudoplumigaleata]|uniref:DUF1690 domain-containing protein n=1 Tax=Syncephalis pseudoplumigaleata TaxID=1712513 RepID=A0A4P9YYB0_9FUNG|nr:hypothetical protein SYNPS1DRAFT_29229 [Syncephalis pseudoplumigaleata]|eukprot:RKP25024.1 hypothetical protein SYNPS1DRAFT_29229 [Syncephalis pseudoplumigaleata]